MGIALGDLGDQIAAAEEENHTLDREYNTNSLGLRKQIHRAKYQPCSCCLHTLVASSLSFEQSQRPVGTEQDLRVAIFSLVELVVRLLRILQTHLVTDHETGLRIAGNDEIPKISVVLLDITLARCEAQALNVVSKRCLKQMCNTGWVDQARPKSG